MTVPRPRDVFGPARRPSAWWDADQAGRPLTVPQAFWLRRLPRSRHQLPGVTARSLARRGLLNDKLNLTPDGEHAKRVLGILPEALLIERHASLPAYTRERSLPHHLSLGPLHTPTRCDTCGRTVPAELIAWGHPDRVCVRCATLEEA